MKTIVLLFSCMLLASNAHSESVITTPGKKWKKEIFALSLHIGGYIKTYKKFIDNKLNKSDFDSKANGYIAKIEKLKQVIQSNDSDSSDPKFEKRKEKMLLVIDKALPVMRSGKALSASIKDHLK